MFLEVISTSLLDVDVINQAENVNRIELCSDLNRGGFTPEYKTIKICCEASQVPIRVIFRHDDRNFFCESREYDQIKEDIKFIKTTKADGIVAGIITPQKEVDIPRMRELVALADPLNVTFHRAFDEIIDKVEAIKELKILKINTVLTQGGDDNITSNLKVLESLRHYGVQIQGGGGINFSNYEVVMKHCDAIHIGSAVRVNNSWDENIDLDKLLQVK